MSEGKDRNAPSYYSLIYKNSSSNSSIGGYVDE
jgi:hypothetical protein